MTRRPVRELEPARFGDVFAFGPHLSMFLTFVGSDGYWIAVALGPESKPEVGHRLPFLYVHHDPIDGDRRWERIE